MPRVVHKLLKSGSSFNTDNPWHFFHLPFGFCCVPLSPPPPPPPKSILSVEAREGGGKTVNCLDGGFLFGCAPCHIFELYV